MAISNTRACIHALTLWYNAMCTMRVSRWWRRGKADGRMAGGGGALTRFFSFTTTNHFLTIISIISISTNLFQKRVSFGFKKFRPVKGFIICVVAGIFFALSGQRPQVTPVCRVAQSVKRSHSFIFCVTVGIFSALTFLQNFWGHLRQSSAC